MINFSLRLNPPANSYSFISPMPVYLENTEHEIGICTILHLENIGMVGRFSLNTDVWPQQFVLYNFMWPDFPEREFNGIIIANVAENANTIGNSIV
jgi:hypothetical protein